MKAEDGSLTSFEMTDEDGHKKALMSFRPKGEIFRHLNTSVILRSSATKNLLWGFGGNIKQILRLWLRMT